LEILYFFKNNTIIILKNLQIFYSSITVGIGVVFIIFSVARFLRNSIGFFNRNKIKWTNSFFIKMISNIFLSINSFSFALLFYKKFCDVFCNQFCNEFGILFYLFIFNGICWLICVSLLYFEYRRRLDQTWLGLRGFWFLNGISYMIKIICYYLLKVIFIKYFAKLHKSLILIEILIFLFWLILEYLSNSFVSL